MLANGQTLQALRWFGYGVSVEHRRPLKDSTGAYGAGGYGPDGRELLYTKQQLRNINEGLGEPTVWSILPLAFSDFGGETRVLILKTPEEDAQVLGIGIAGCYTRDRFDRRMGLTIALGRALKDADFDREMLARWWLRYAQMGDEERREAIEAHMKTMPPPILREIR